jgi:hypothetical protein
VFLFIDIKDPVSPLSEPVPVAKRPLKFPSMGRAAGTIRRQARFLGKLLRGRAGASFLGNAPKAVKIPKQMHECRPASPIGLR